MSRRRPAAHASKTNLEVLSKENRPPGYAGMSKSEGEAGLRVSPTSNGVYRTERPIIRRRKLSNESFGDWTRIRTGIVPGGRAILLRTRRSRSCNRCAV